MPKASISLLSTRALGALLAAGFLICATATAQTTYRWTDPKTGRPVISDQPPPPGVDVTDKRAAQTERDPLGALPYQTRQVARKFPVTLYTAADCVPCDQGRQLLIARGVPFEQHNGSSRENRELLKTLTGKDSVPVLLVGKQTSPGFEPGTWNQLLDLAGYPATASAGYRPPQTLAPIADNGAAAEARGEERR
jgi:glutaredoxin